MTKNEEDDAGCKFRVPRSLESRVHMIEDEENVASLDASSEFLFDLSSEFM